jgi:hypothetical protein
MQHPESTPDGIRERAITVELSQDAATKQSEIARVAEQLGN